MKKKRFVQGDDNGEKQKFVCYQREWKEWHE